MEYSLQKLNTNLEIKLLTTNQLIDKLNIVGFEVDAISKSQNILNNFLEDTKILLKIPANREDLLIEKIFNTEISLLFSIRLFPLWKKVLNSYSFLLKKKYFQYFSFKFIVVKSQSPELLICNIEIDNLSNDYSPLWIQRKIANFGQESKNNFQDILKLISIEWGQTFTFINLNEKQDISNFSNEFRNNIFFSPFKIEEMDSVKNKKKIIIEGIYYDIHTNTLKLNSIINQFSLKYLRKSFLHYFKFSYQRLLTLLEIIYSVSISSKIYSNVEIQANELRPNKILILKKNVLLKILNLTSINFEIFKNSGLTIICKTPEQLYIEIPFSRNDLNREIDIIEEYSRFVGYQNFEDIFPTKSLSFLKRKKENINFIKQYFLTNGFNEVVTNSLEDKKKQNLESISLSNPLNLEFASLRTELVSKLIEIFFKNLRTSSKSKNFFEIGRTFKNTKNKIVENEKIAGIFQLPLLQEKKLSEINWFFAKGFLENFLQNFGYFCISVEKISLKHTYFHLTKSICIRYNNNVVGFFGEINPKIENLALLKTPIYIFELNLDYLSEWKMNSSIQIYKEYSKYPSIIKDLSFFADKNIDFLNLKQYVEKNCRYLKTLEFFDIYINKKIEKNLNIGIRLEFQSLNETLLTYQIEETIENLKILLKKEFDLELKK